MLNKMHTEFSKDIGFNSFQQISSAIEKCTTLRANFLTTDYIVAIQTNPLGLCGSTKKIFDQSTAIHKYIIEFNFS